MPIGGLRAGSETGRLTVEWPLPAQPMPGNGISPPNREAYVPRYFFNYRTDDELVRDQDGRDLPNLDAAEQSAAELGRAIVEEAASTGGDTRLPRSIEITDDAGEDLLYVVFWAGPKVGGGPGIPVEPVTVH